MRPRNAHPSTRGPQSAYRPAERAEGGLCALRAAPNPMSEREHELHRRMTSPTERHRAWSRSWARTERAVPRDPFAGGVGSSPHTRGALRPGAFLGHRLGDHPRIRGEHVAAPDAVVLVPGIIPAYAGNTARMAAQAAALAGSSPHTRGTRCGRRSASFHSWDHPRIRGEHETALAVGHLGLGIIPAYAGNTVHYEATPRANRGSSPHTRGTLRWHPFRYLVCWDHPRIRGEHALGQVDGAPVLGIIPAYAGNTCSQTQRCFIIQGSSPHTRGTRGRARCRCRRTRDHPRIRGEHAADGADVAVEGGIIPAYAGNTDATGGVRLSSPGSSPHTRGTPTCPVWCPGQTRDHPRIRGEHHPLAVRVLRAVGIIPAYAGNTFYELNAAQGYKGSSPHTRGTL